MGKIYQVVVNGVRGGKVVVDLSNTEEQFKSMTVEQLSEKIRQRLPEIADADCRLIFTDKNLDEGTKLLSEYGIQHMSVIQVVLRIPGGGSLPSETSGMGDKTGKNRSMESLWLKSF